VKHFHEPGDLHEFTFSCYQRRPLLSNDRWRRYSAESIDAASEQFRFQFIAFVFMPEHVHMLTLPLDDEPAIDRYLAAIKRPVFETPSPPTSRWQNASGTHSGATGLWPVRSGCTGGPSTFGLTPKLLRGHD
jgi:putative transposase